MGRSPPEKMGEDQPHDQKMQQWVEHAPEHAQGGSCVFPLEISFDQFLKKELVFFHFKYEFPDVFLYHH